MVSRDIRAKLTRWAPYLTRMLLWMTLGDLENALADHLRGILVVQTLINSDLKKPS